MASVTRSEIATIVAALARWKDATCGVNEDSSDEGIYFSVPAPLSESQIDSLIGRLNTAQVELVPGEMKQAESWQHGVFIPTYVGQKNAGMTPPAHAEDFGAPDVPVLIAVSDGIRLILGTHNRKDTSKPDVQVERRPHGWSLFIHPDGSDPVAILYILDDGRTFLLHEPACPNPLRTVENTPLEVDWS